MDVEGASSILVVEDDALTRTFLRRALGTAGLTTIDAANGEEALGLVRTQPGFAACLIDGLLPDMHGSALAGHILEEPAGSLIPLLFVTGALRQAVAPHAGLAALVKPFTVTQLLEQVVALRSWREAGGSPLSDRRQALADLVPGFLLGP